MYVYHVIMYITLRDMATLATAKEMMKWCINYPREMLALLDANVLPRQKADSKTGRPAYQYEPRAGGLGKST